MITVGSTVGNYTIIAPVGEGAMAAVYLAEHPRIGKRVAIKVIHPELATSQEMVSRFFTEARAASQVRHDHVVEIQDFGRTPDGDNFIIMEYLEGDTLTTRLTQQGAFEVKRAVAVANQICEGLAAAHGRGVIHRDLKPDNIYLVRRASDPDFVKILDFGLAKLIGGAAAIEAQHRTRTGSVLGTPHYMSPEQCEGKAAVDGRADLYSLGCILYQMLSGQLPFPGDGFGEVLVKHIRQMPAPLRTQNPKVTPALEKVVLHCLAKKREYRFQSAGELVQALRDPERFSVQIGNNIRLIIGPLPGEPDPGPPIQLEQPPTLVGDVGGGNLLPPPPAPPAPPAGPAPPAMPAGSLAADQRTIIAGPSGLSPQAGMETVAGPLSPLAGTPATVMLGGPPPELGNRTGRTVAIEDPYPSSHEMPTLVPGGPPIVPVVPPGKRPGPGLPTAGDRRPRRAVAVAVGAVCGLVALLVLLVLPALRPRSYVITVTSTPDQAQVLRDGQVVGETPYVLKLTRGEAASSLVVRKDGFFDATRAVQADRDQVLSVTLVKKPDQQPKSEDEAQVPKADSVPKPNDEVVPPRPADHPTDRPTPKPERLHRRPPRDEGKKNQVISPF